MRREDDGRRRARQRARLRAVVAVWLFVLWGSSAVTGFLLYAAPTGRRSGQVTYVLFTKATWGDIHFWVSVAAGIVTILHVVIDWRALRACARFLRSTDRPAELA